MSFAPQHDSTSLFSAEKINVCLRMRPILQNEKLRSHTAWKIEGNQIKSVTRSKTQSYISMENFLNKPKSLKIKKI